MNYHYLCAEDGRAFNVINSFRNALLEQKTFNSILDEQLKSATKLHLKLEAKLNVLHQRHQSPSSQSALLDQKHFNCSLKVPLQCCANVQLRIDTTLNVMEQQLQRLFTGKVLAVQKQFESALGQQLKRVIKIQLDLESALNEVETQLQEQFEALKELVPNNVEIGLDEAIESDAQSMSTLPSGDGIHLESSTREELVQKKEDDGATESNYFEIKFVEVDRPTTVDADEKIPDVSSEDQPSDASHSLASPRHAIYLERSPRKELAPSMESDATDSISFGSDAKLQVHNQRNECAESDAEIAVNAQQNHQLTLSNARPTNYVNGSAELGRQLRPRMRQANANGACVIIKRLNCPTNRSRTIGNGAKGAKPLKCSICNTRFNGNSDLKRHLMIHTGEKPFKCSTCNAVFRRNYHLTRHYGTHAIKKYKCDFCKRSFKRKDQLSSHMRTHIVKKTALRDAASAEDPLLDTRKSQ